MRTFTVNRNLTTYPPHMEITPELAQATGGMGLSMLVSRVLQWERTANNQTRLGNR